MRSWRINSCTTHKSAESPDIAMSPDRSTVWPRKWGSWRSRGNESKPLPFLCHVVDGLFYERGISQSISALSPRKFSSDSVKESMVKSYMYAPMNIIFSKEEWNTFITYPTYFRSVQWKWPFRLILIFFI